MRTLSEISLIIPQDKDSLGDCIGIIKKMGVNYDDKEDSSFFIMLKFLDDRPVMMRLLKDHVDSVDKFQLLKDVVGNINDAIRKDDLVARSIRRN